MLVAVVDTGVDAHTPQLAGRVLAGVDLTGQPGGAADADCHGHGTFVAGIIAAAPAPGGGFAGIAPAATILPVRVTSTSQVAPGLLAEGIRVAVDHGAKVVNVSASARAPDPALAAAVAHAEQRDAVVVAAAGNDDRRGDGPTYPAAYPTVLAVGAVDSTGQRADFSETGPYLALAAPGVNVISVGPGGPGQWEGSGTSYAAPFVAGVAALVRADHPELTAAQVRARLTATAEHPVGPLPDPGLGWGVVNPLAAVTAVLPEHGAAGAPAGSSPASASRPSPPRPDRRGPLLTGFALVGAVVGGCAAAAIAWLARVSGQDRTADPPR